MTTAVLLAGGLGTRLAVVSGGVPKPLIEVAGRPFIEYVLDHALEHGISDFVIAVSYRWETLQYHLGNSYRGHTISWSIEKVPLGTGGAIYKALEDNNLARAIVMNADTLFLADLSQLEIMHQRYSKNISIALRTVPDISRYGAVSLNKQGYIENFIEKGMQGPGLINGGIYLIERHAFSSLEINLGAFSFEQDMLLPRLKQLQPFGMVSNAYFIDIGIPQDLEKARIDLLDPID